MPELCSGSAVGNWAYGRIDCVSQNLSQTPSSFTGDRVGLKVYPGWHMFYNRPESLMAFLKDAKALYGIK